jgi:hypothetical protein
MVMRFDRTVEGKDLAAVPKSGVKLLPYWAGVYWAGVGRFNPDHHNLLKDYRERGSAALLAN